MTKIIVKMIKIFIKTKIILKIINKNRIKIWLLKIRKKMIILKINK